ncbi:DUF4344 domain-containing metallopeptidase [Streptomyces violascens]|uniref:Metallopeptidase DUF4344 n=1 Tax=Streptomyces violascens TaxID=67381 RepID=A0ABQ3QV76_9ACTN|nr:DUF4344 domain-containing metallopeptidase [Streptomyces violascens]GGU26329.1 hypothetical protein GCM10010289_54530 [Streptomyces violascens]GHI41190.1 hypothetical protein Sviol_55980 [Streptomyces violascens]
MGARDLRHVVGAGLGAILLLSCTTTGGDVRGPDRGSSSGFTTRYEKPSAADQVPGTFLRSRKLPEAAAEALNTLVALDRQIVLVSRSCDGEGSAYDAQTRHIELCYDGTVEDRVLFQNAGHHPADDEAAAVAAETVYHEAGHALIDLLDVSLTSRQEEDAADQFAALMLLRTGLAGERQLRTAAEAYELSAAANITTETSGRDEHSPDLTRAANHLCYLYGSASTRNQDLATTSRIPSKRVIVNSCGSAGQSASWDSASSPSTEVRVELSALSGAGAVTSTRV